VPDIRRCQPAEQDRALSTVVDAFAVDPLLRWVWPEDERYAACAPGFFGLLLELRLASGEVWVADGGDAVSMWDPPGGLLLPTPDRTWTDLQEGFTPVERGRWAAFEDALRVPDDTPPYWYLGVLATLPARQGTGLGRAVLAPILAAADRTHLATYLETASDANLRFYAQLGFSVFREAVMPTGPPCWLLRRNPGTTP
jgi:GNAT superfamily N-acetyltransferase